MLHNCEVLCCSSFGEGRKLVIAWQLTWGNDFGTILVRSKIVLGAVLECFYGRKGIQIGNPTESHSSGEALSVLVPPFFKWITKILAGTCNWLLYSTVRVSCRVSCPRVRFWIQKWIPSRMFVALPLCDADCCFWCRQSLAPCSISRPVIKNETINRTCRNRTFSTGGASPLSTMILSQSGGRTHLMRCFCARCSLTGASTQEQLQRRYNKWSRSSWSTPLRSFGTLQDEERY